MATLLCMHVLFEYIIAMADVDAFDIFGEEVPFNNAEEAAEVVEVQPAPQHNGVAPRLNWTPVMSAFVLTKFLDLIAEGVRIDKGFKGCKGTHWSTSDSYLGVQPPPEVACQVGQDLQAKGSEWSRMG